MPVLVFRHFLDFSFDLILKIGLFIEPCEVRDTDAPLVTFSSRTRVPQNDILATSSFPHGLAELVLRGFLVVDRCRHVGCRLRHADGLWTTARDESKKAGSLSFARGELLVPKYGCGFV